MTQAIKKLKTYVGMEEEEASLQDEISGMCPSLTYKQRMYGFAICFVVGWFISLLSVITISTSIRKFGVLYSFGNILSLCSTGFLWGPCKQFKSMFSLTRITATCIYLIFIGLTLYLAFDHPDKIGAIVLCIICQFLAMIWYCLSYS